jgi:hypothetical protein
LSHDHPLTSYSSVRPVAAPSLARTAWQAGFSTALADVLEYLQHNLDLPEQTSDASQANAIAQVIDYIEVGTSI